MIDPSKNGPTRQTWGPSRVKKVKSAKPGFGHFGWSKSAPNLDKTLTPTGNQADLIAVKHFGKMI